MKECWEEGESGETSVTSGSPDKVLQVKSEEEAFQTDDLYIQRS